jgi:hypothetical protein
MRNLSIIAVITALAFTSCQKLESIQPTPNISAKKSDSKNEASALKERTTSNFGAFNGEICGEPVVTKLLAGQFIEVGTVTVFNDEFNVYVTYSLTASGWNFGTIHLYVGALSGVPVNQTGNPVPGLFPYKAVVNGSTQTYTFTIPITDLPECYIVAAHAEVNGRSRETAWGQGTPFVSKGNWGTYFSDCKDECELPPL